MQLILRALLFTFMLTLVLQTLPAQAAQVHRVTTGETLFQIAQQYGVSANQIIAKNPLRNPDKLFNNQVLIIPAAQERTTDIYLVQPGDSLSKIAAKLNVSASVLAQQNNLANADYLDVGQALTIPVTREAAGQLTARTGVNNTYTLARDFSDSFFLFGEPAGSNKIAITFDDGPDALYTGQILDILKHQKIPATFFLIGQKSLNHPQVVQRIHREGHVIGNHTWSHPNLAKVDKEKLQSEVLDTEEAIKKLTGLRTSLVRPPYGSLTRETLEYLRQNSYITVNWSVDSVDWKDRQVDQILINTLPDVKDGGIILFHSGGGEGQDLSATVSMLPELIHTLRVNGYTFVTLDELLSVPAYK